MSTYQLLDLIGRGGMGDVFETSRILSDGTHTRVACKRMHDQLRDDPTFVGMFFREARINLDISHNHPGLVTVHECLEDSEGRSHLIMEFVDGCNLLTLRNSKGLLPWDIVRLVARDVLETLAYVHERGIVHRDISPCNILVSCEGAIKISDLGLAKVIGTAQTDPHVFRGKWAYGSPEAIQRKDLDERADLFSFAALLYEHITTQRVYGDVQSFADLEKQLVTWSPPELSDDVPLDLRDLISGLLQASPNDRRPATARQALPLLASFNADSARVQLANLARSIYDRKRSDREPGESDRANIAQNPIVIKSRVRIDPLAVTDHDTHQFEPGPGNDTPSVRPPSGSPHPPNPPKKRRGLLAVALALVFCALGWLGYEHHTRDTMPRQPIDTAEVSERSGESAREVSNERSLTATPSTSVPITVSGDNDGSVEESTNSDTSPDPQVAERSRSKPAGEKPPLPRPEPAIVRDWVASPSKSDLALASSP